MPSMMEITTLLGDDMLLFHSMTAPIRIGLPKKHVEAPWRYGVR